MCGSTCAHNQRSRKLSWISPVDLECHSYCRVAEQSSNYPKENYEPIYYLMRDLWHNNDPCFSNISQTLCPHTESWRNPPDQRIIPIVKRLRNFSPKRTSESIHIRRLLRPIWVPPRARVPPSHTLALIPPRGSNVYVKFYPHDTI